MEDKDVILEAMRKAGEPLNAGKVAELTGLDRKAVDKAFAAMKKTGEIVAPCTGLTKKRMRGPVFGRAP